MSHEPHSLERLRIDRSKTAARPFPWLWVLGLGVLLLLGGTYVWWTYVREVPIPVRTAPSKLQSAQGPQVLLNASGYVTARLAATVSSKVTGKVSEVFVEEGLRVELGQVLARLDAVNTEVSMELARAQLEAARSGVEETRASLALAESELKRSQALHQRAVLADAELDRTQAEAAALRARLARMQAEVLVAERQVAVWQQQLDDAVIRAPFAGVVTSKNAQPGEMISPMSAGGGFTRTGICTLVAMESLEIEVDVNEAYINRVLAGQNCVATLDSYPDWKIPTRVLAIIPTADRQKASVRVRVGFLKLDPRILPDMGVKVAFEGTPGEASSTTARVLVPAKALRSRQGRDLVFVVRDARVEERAVRVGARLAEDVSITAGLSGGETLVLDPPATLAEGSLVIEAKP